MECIWPLFTLTLCKFCLKRHFVWRNELQWSNGSSAINQTQPLYHLSTFKMLPMPLVHDLCKEHVGQHGKKHNKFPLIAVSFTHITLHIGWNQQFHHLLGAQRIMARFANFQTLVLFKCIHKYLLLMTHLALNLSFCVELETFGLHWVIQRKIKF